MKSLIEKYIDYIRKEFKYLEETKYTGHIDFRVNWKQGNIGNMNLGVNQSVKLE